MRLPAHVIISWIFFFFCVFVLAYSWYFYPGDVHPVDCVFRSATGRDCPSCGFSRCFSFYTHFGLDEGRTLNPLSWPVFLFFVLQLLMRTFVILHFYLRKKSLSSALVKTDIVISISAFLLAFLPLLIKFSHG